VTHDRIRTALLTVPLAALLMAACALEPTSEPDPEESGGAGAVAGSGGVAGSSGGSGGTGGGAGQTGGSGAQAGQGGSNAGAGGSALAGQGGIAGSGGSGGSGGTGGGSGGAATSGAGGTNQAGSGGTDTAGTGGLAGAGAAGASAGAAGASGAAGGTGTGELGNGMMTGMGRSDERYETTEVGRNGVPYMLITNGWGPGFQSHTVSWNGTSFIVETMSGSRGSGGQPASYPSVFCGRYSVQQVPDCGLPLAMDQITSLRTGWRWAANGNTGAYNAAYDIWLGNGSTFTMYLMVWLRDPPNEQPAGAPDAANQGVTVANVEGVWDIWTGTVNSRPIINWIRREGMDSSEIEFDVMDFIRDAQMRGLNVTGTHVNAVAVGFEIWQGPVTNLESTDFYVDVN